MIPIAFWVFEPALLLGVPDGGEVGRQRWLRSDGDDLAVLLPDRLEQLGEQLAALGRLGLGGPEAPEVIEYLPCAIEVGIGRWVAARDLFFKSLASHDVLGLGEVAHQIEIAQALKLREQAPPFAALLSVGLPGLVTDRFDDLPAQVGVSPGVERPERVNDWISARPDRAVRTRNARLEERATQEWLRRQLHAQ